MTRWGSGCLLLRHVMMVLLGHCLGETPGLTLTPRECTDQPSEPFFSMKVQSVQEVLLLYDALFDMVYMPQSFLLLRSALSHPW